MTRSEAGRILGVDEDALADLEDVLEIESWTVDGLTHAAEILDAEDDDEESDDDEIDAADPSDEDDDEDDA